MTTPAFEEVWPRALERAQQWIAEGRPVVTPTGVVNHIVRADHSGIWRRSEHWQSHESKKITKNALRRAYEERANGEEVSGLYIYRHLLTAFFELEGGRGGTAQPSATRPASDPGIPDHERHRPAFSGLIEGNHRKIHAALKQATLQADGWQISEIALDARVSPDLAVESGDRMIRVVFEIKSGCTLADTYEAMGQLLYYNASLWGDSDLATYMVLVLLGEPGAEIRGVLDSLEFNLFVAHETGSGIEFDIDVVEWLKQ